jgi:hypothetical protein
MSHEIPNLLPEDIGVENVVTPVAVLRALAAQLGQKTEQLITGDVTTSLSSAKFVHEFFLMVPSLDFYRYRVFFIRHPIDSFYPVDVHGDGLPEGDLNSQGELENWLRNAFASPSIKKLLNTLYTQVRT